MEEWSIAAKSLCIMHKIIKWVQTSPFSAHYCCCSWCHKSTDTIYDLFWKFTVSTCHMSITVPWVQIFIKSELGMVATICCLMIALPCHQALSSTYLVCCQSLLVRFVRCIFSSNLLAITIKNWLPHNRWSTWLPAWTINIVEQPSGIYCPQELVLIYDPVCTAHIQLWHLHQILAKFCNWHCRDRE